MTAGTFVNRYLSEAVLGEFGLRPTQSPAVCATAWEGGPPIGTTCRGRSRFRMHAMPGFDPKKPSLEEGLLRSFVRMIAKQHGVGPASLARL